MEKNNKLTELSNDQVKELFNKYAGAIYQPPDWMVEVMKKMLVDYNQQMKHIKPNYDSK